MKTNRTTIAKKSRPSICTSTIATAAMVLTQVASFAPSASAEIFTTPFGTQAPSGLLAGPDLIMNGGGLLLLSTGQTYGGTTTINDGSVSITGPSALGVGTSVVVIDGPQINGVNFQATRAGGGGNLTVGGGLTYARDLSLRGFGSTGDTAALTSVGNNTFSGAIATGTGAAARIASTSGLATISGPVTIGAGQSLQFIGNSGNSLLSGSTTATTGQVIKILGSGLLELTGTNLHSGGTRVDAGFLRVGNAAAVGTSTAASAIQMNGGTLELRTNSPAADGWTGTKNVQGSANNSVLFLAPAVGGTAINQTVAFNNLNVTINTNLTITGRDGYGASFNGMTSQGNNNTTLNNGANGLVTYTTGNFWNQNDGTARTLNLGGPGNSQLNGNIRTSGAAHNITKLGAGTFTILATGTGSNFTGNTNIGGGTLAINSITALNNAATGSGSRINIGSGTAGTLAFVGSGAAADYNVAKIVNMAGTTDNATINANQTSAEAVVIPNFSVTGVGSKTLTLGGTNTQNNLISGAIVNGGTGTTSFTKNGSGTWALSGTNTYTGNTTINDGTLKLNANAASSTIIADTSNLIFNTNGGTLELVGQAATNNIETLGILTPTAGASTLKLSPGAGGNASLVFVATGTATSGLGTINNSSSVNIVGATPTSTVTLTGVPDGTVDPHITYNGADFAIATTGVLSAPVYDVTAGYNTAGGAAFSSGNHNLVNAAITTVAPDTIKTLKISGSQTVTLGGLLTINAQGLASGANTAGAILQTGGSSTITGAGISTGTAGNLVIRVDGASDTLTLDATAAITATGGGLTKNGAGTLTMAGTNAQTGQTTINEGTLKLSGAGRISAANAALVIRRNGTLDLNGVNSGTAIGAFNGEGKVTNSGAAATLTTGNNNGTGTFSGLIEDGLSGAGGLSIIKQGTGAQTWSGLNTYTGSTRINSTGIVSVTTLANGGVASSLGASSNAASNLVFGGSTGAISYTGAATTSTDRLFTLAGSGGRIQANGANNAGLTFSNTGAIVVTGTVAQTLTLGGGSTANNVFNPQIVDGAGAATVGVRKEDAGLWILGNSTNSYSGQTAINNGTLQADGSTLPATSALAIGVTTTGTTGTAAIFQSSGTFTRALGTGPGQVAFLAGGTSSGIHNAGFAGSSSKLSVNIGGGSTLTWNTPNMLRDGLLLNSVTALSEVDIQNPIDLNGANREIQVLDNTNTASDFATVSGVISGAAGVGIIKTGAGLLHLTGANTYLGDTQIRAGVVTVRSLGQSAGAGTSNVGADGAGAVNLGFNNSGGTLDYVGVGETSSRAIQATGTSGATSTIRSNGTGALILSNVVNTATGTAGRTIALGGENTGPNEITNLLADNGGPLGITKQDGGVWITNLAHTYSGSTTVNSGALGIGADASGAVGAVTSGPLGVGTLVLGNGSIMALNGDRTIINNVTIANNTTPGFMGDNSITINSPVVVANGNNANAYNNFLPSGEALIINGQFSHNDTNNKTQTFQGSGSTIINGLITNTNTGNLNLALNATGGGTLRISGGAGANTYGGSTTLTSGTLILDKAGAIPTVGTANIVNLNGGNLAATPAHGGVITNTTVVGGNPTMIGTQTIEFSGTVTNSGGNRVVTNSITGVGNELKLSGTVNLSENNTGRTFTVAGAGTTTVSGLVQNGGTAGGQFATDGSGLVTLTNPANTYSNGTVVNGGTLKVGAAGAIPDVGTVTVRKSQTVGATDGVFDLNGISETIGALSMGSTATNAVNAGQTPSVINSGAPAVLTLAGNVTYNAGTAAFQNGTATISANLGLNGNRTFVINGSTGTTKEMLVSGVISNGTAAAANITKTGTGVLELTGNNTFTGSTTIAGGTASAGGTLRAAGAGALGATSAVIVQTGGILELAGAGDRINNAAPITLGAASTPVVTTAATLATNGLSEDLGVLTLAGPVGGVVSVIDLGAGTSILKFANSFGAGWTAGSTLSIWNWSGIAETGGGIDQVFFGTDTTGLTLGQLGSINFYGDAGSAFLGTAVFATSANGEITIPEPGTIGSLIGGFGLLLSLRRRKARRA